MTDEQAAVPCPRTRRFPGSKMNTTRTVPCAGTIRPTDDDEYACTHCRYRYSHQDVEALRKASSHPPTPKQRMTAQQMSLLGDIV